MRIKRKLLPGQPGTKQLVSQYGKDLVCVRYRYDKKQNRRFKTIELIIDEGPWTPNSTKTHLNKAVNIRIKHGARDLIKSIMAVGGKWDSQRKVWKLSYGKAIYLGLEDRIVD